MVELRRLSVNDGRDIYDMLQEIPESENNYGNPVNGMTYDKYKEFLIERDKESRTEGIIDGWMVPSTKYWLYVDGEPVGVGDIRHFLTDALKNAGGNIGYAIRPGRRGMGYGKKLLELLLDEAKSMRLENVLITALPSNKASIGVALANGGIIIKETDERVKIMVPLGDYSDFRIETKDLILRKAKQEDWKSLYYNLRCHEESAKYMSWTPDKSEQETQNRIQKTIINQSLFKYTFHVCLKQNNEVIGYANFARIDNTSYEDNGIALGPNFVHKGYGKQILNAVAEQLKADGVKKLYCGYRQKNIASKMLQESCGFQYDHTSQELTDSRTGEKYYIDYMVKELN